MHIPRGDALWRRTRAGPRIAGTANPKFRPQVLDTVSFLKKTMQCLFAVANDQITKKKRRANPAFRPAARPRPKILIPKKPRAGPRYAVPAHGENWREQDVPRNVRTAVQLYGRT